MGGCCHRDIKENKASEAVDYYIRQNCKLFDGLILCFMELEERGAMLKIIKIKKLTKDYYDGNQHKRCSLGNNGVLINVDFGKLVEEELNQVSNTHKVLQKTLKTIMKELKISIFTSDSAYLQTLLNKYRHCSRFNWVYSMYDKANRGEWDFERCVAYVNQGKPLNPTYDSLIREICKTTTYLINNRDTRISYEETVDTRKTNRPRRASISHREREPKIVDFKKSHSL